MRNPFADERSPIQQIYKRSRSKSKQNTNLVRCRSTSFRDFQVKIIQQALKHNHILSKEYGKEERNQYQRHKMQSKYYGTQSQRYDSPSTIQPMFSSPPLTSEYQIKENQRLKSVRFQNMSSMNSGIGTMMDTKQFQNPNYVRKKMSYESNYSINGSESMYSCSKIRSSKKLQNSNRSSKIQQRRCSITNSLSDNELDYFKLENLPTNSGSNHKFKVDKVREQYYETEAKTSSKRGSKGKIRN